MEAHSCRPRISESISVMSSLRSSANLVYLQNSMSMAVSADGLYVCIDYGWLVCYKTLCFYYARSSKSAAPTLGLY